MVRIKTEWNTIRHPDNCHFCEREIGGGTLAVTTHYFSDGDWQKARIHADCFVDYAKSVYEEYMHRERSSRKPKLQVKRGRPPMDTTEEQKKNRNALSIKVSQYQTRLTAHYARGKIVEARKAWGTLAESLAQITEEDYGVPYPQITLQRELLLLVEDNDNQMFQGTLALHDTMINNPKTVPEELKNTPVQDPVWIGKGILKRLEDLQEDTEMREDQ